MSHSAAPMGPFDPIPPANQGLVPDGMSGGSAGNQGFQAYVPPSGDPSPSTSGSSLASGSGRSPGSMSGDSFSTASLSSNLPAESQAVRDQQEPSRRGSLDEPMTTTNTIPESEVSIVFESLGGAKPKQVKSGPMKAKSRVSEKSRAPPVVTIDSDTDISKDTEDPDHDMPIESHRPQIKEDMRKKGPGSGQRSASKSLKSPMTSVASSNRPGHPYSASRSQAGKSPNKDPQAGVADPRCGNDVDESLEVKALRRKLAQKVQTERFYNEPGINSVSLSGMPFFSSEDKKKTRVQEVVKAKIIELNLPSEKISRAKFDEKCRMDPVDACFGKWNRQYKEFYDRYVNEMFSEYMGTEYYDRGGKLIEDRAEKFIAKVKASFEYV